MRVDRLLHHRHWGFVWGLVLLLPLLFAHGDTIPLAPDEQAWIKEHPEWRAVGSSSPPFQWIDKDGVYRGIAADYDKILSEKLGMKVRAVYADSWPASVEQLKNHEIDACTLLIANPEREEYLAFTKEIAALPTAVFVRSDNDSIKTAADLDRQIVAVPKSWAVEMNLRRDYPQMDLQPYTTTDEALLAVSTGQTVAYAGDIASTTHAIEKLGITNLKVAFMLPYTLSLSMGVRKDWPEFIPILNKAIDAITEDEHDSIRQRWMAIRNDGVSLTEVLQVVLPSVGVLGLLGLILYVSSLRQEVRRRRAAEREVIDTQNATVVALAALAETRDTDTGGHLRRTQEYVKSLALALRQRGFYQDILNDAYIELLYSTSPLHDVGKVGIPDSILQKPGRLAEEEFAIMQTHTTLGANALGRARTVCVKGSGFLELAAEIALSHHERWDGKGYPQGLQGNTIPLSGRIMAVADVYDALISKRCYKDAVPHDKVIAIIREERGRQFDPAVVDAFLAIEKDIHQISQSFADHQ